jgi:glycine/D-amino acid oxidase-like deaminating enzyme
MAGNLMRGIHVEPAGILDADFYVFACGPWLGQIFPRLAQTITPTRQEVFFFGAPAGDSLFSDARMPAWIDGGQHQFYGIPGNQWRGFKMADDARGAPVDPSTMDRQISAEGLATARNYLRLRFPKMAGAPLLESRVCQYENTADHNLILDRHPEAENVWIVGGGSGHGFKHGPAVGEMLANAVLGVKAPPGEMRLGARLANAFS